jgi:aminobenzoyl-glutamate transport protein
MGQITTENPKTGRILNTIERFGNRLPHPAMLFLYLIIIIMILSWLLHFLGASVTQPGTGEQLAVKSLVSSKGLLYIIDSLFSNFIEFKPLGLVLVFTLGVGLAEKVGFFDAAIKRTIIRAPKSIISYAVIFIGIMGSITADAAYIIVPPIAAMIFMLFGRNPIAGLAAGIAGVGCGFSANLFVSAFDAMLSGISTEVAQTIDPNMIVKPVDNWYFMSISVFVLTIVGGLVTEKIVEPRLGPYKGNEKITFDNDKDPKVSLLISKALRNTLIAAIVYIALVILALFIPDSPLRGENGSIIDSPLMSGISTFIFLLFIIIGLTYGVTAKKINSPTDAVNYMIEAIKDISGFVVLVFIIAQFIAYLQWTNISLLTAVNGAELLKSVDLVGIPAIILLVLLTVISSLFITSGTALWSVLAPIFIPMFMLIDIHPAIIQVSYRIGDSVTNMITPLNPFVAVMLGFLMKYDKKAGLGTHVALILPYTIAFLIVWLIMLIAFLLLDIPIGPGVTMNIK